MWQAGTCLALFVAVLAAAGPASAQVSRSGLISDAAARQHGLTRAWHTQIRLNRARGRVAYITQHISSTRTQTIYQVVSDHGTFDFSERALDKLGDPLGKVGAAERAAEKIVELVEQAKASPPAGADLAELKATGQAAEQVLQNIKDSRQEKEEPADGSEPQPVSVDALLSPLLRRATAAPDLLPKLVPRVIPDITLFVSTNQGVIHAIDGETGRTRWVMPAGRPNHPNMAPAANDKCVAVVNGSKLFVINGDTGKLIWQRWLEGAPGASPAINDDMVYVPMVNGKVEVHEVAKLDQKSHLPLWIASAGRALVRPTASSLSVGWPTDRGYFYVSDALQLTHRYRLEANRTIVAPASYVRGKFLVASIDGFVYCLQEMNGALLWRFSTGEPISHTPIPIGDFVYVVTDYGGMYRVALDTGQDQWWIPRVRRFLAASERRVYCADRVGRLMIIDATSGGQIGSMATETLDLQFTNGQTDRLLLGTRTGLLQCLHETPLDKPLFHIEVEIQQQQLAETEEKAEPGAKAEEKPAAEESPFGTGTTDPFGGGGKMTDPFGAGSSTDPFGGGGEKEADPFGTGGAKDSDPFGTSKENKEKDADPFR